MTTPESRTVEPVCPACHHRDHQPGSCPECPRCELHTDEALAFVLRVEPDLVLAAAKEHGLVIGKGEPSLNEAWEELDELAKRAGYQIRVTAFGQPPRVGDRYTIASVQDGGGLASEIAILKEALAEKLESRR